MCPRASPLACTLSMPALAHPPAIILSSCSPWSTICITPMGLHRRKEKGCTGSCRRCGKGARLGCSSNVVLPLLSQALVCPAFGTPFSTSLLQGCTPGPNYMPTRPCNTSQLPPTGNPVVCCLLFANIMKHNAAPLLNNKLACISTSTSSGSWSGQ